MLAPTLLLALAPASAQEPVQEPAPVPATEAECLERTRAELARHPYFSKVRWETVVRPPFLFVVQSSPSGGADYAADLAAGYAELLGPLVTRFETDYAAPLGLVRRPEQPLLPIAVLPTRGDFVNYARAATARGHYFADSLYDRDLRAALLFESPFEPQRDARTRAHGALHACVHVLAHAWSSGKRTVEPWPWPLEGLADHLARTHPGHRPPQARKDGPLDDGMVEAAVAAALDPNLGWANLWRVADLAMVEYFPQTDGALRMKAKRLARQQPFDAAPYQAYLRHCALLTRFLHTDAPPPLQEAYRELLRLVLTGTEAPAAYAAAFSATPPDELDRLYRTWIVERYRALFPAKPLDAERILRGDVPALPPGAAPTDLAPAAAPDAPPEAAPAPPPIDAGTLLAMAVFDARRGRAAAALERLAGARELDADAALAARIEREEGRLRAFGAYRDAFLAWAVEGGERVRIEVAGRAPARDGARRGRRDVHVRRRRRGAPARVRGPDAGRADARRSRLGRRGARSRLGARVGAPAGGLGQVVALPARRGRPRDPRARGGRRWLRRAARARRGRLHAGGPGPGSRRRVRRPTRASSSSASAPSASASAATTSSSRASASCATPRRSPSPRSSS